MAETPCRVLRDWPGWWWLPGASALALFGLLLIAARPRLPAAPG